MDFCFTVDDVCLEHFSSETYMARLLDFLAENQVHATFNVVPLAQGLPLRDKPGYVAVLKRALTEGHEIAQHGLEHDRFEFGIPPRMVLDLPHEGPARERVAHDMDAIMAGLTVDKIRARLALGRRLLQDALGIEIVTFRGPCLSICDNLFHALEAEGFLFDSSRHLQEAGWDLLNGKTGVKPRPITRDVFDKLQYPARLTTLPLTTDYSWYLKETAAEATRALARHDLAACQRAGIPFVPVCHVAPIFEGDPADSGLKFYRWIFKQARELAHENNEPLRFPTLKQAGSAIQFQRRNLPA